MSSRAAKFRFEVDGIDETGYPAEIVVLIVLPRVKGQGRAHAKGFVVNQTPVLRRWKSITSIH